MSPPYLLLDFLSPCHDSQGTGSRVLCHLGWTLLPWRSPTLQGIRLHNISLVNEESDLESLLVVAHPTGLIKSTDEDLHFPIF